MISLIHRHLHGSARSQEDKPTVLCSLALLTHSWVMECLTKPTSEPTTPDFSFLKRILFFKLEYVSKCLFKSCWIDKTVVSYSKCIFVWVSLLLGIFFTFFLVLCSVLQVDLHTAAVCGDSFTETAHPKHTCHAWKAQGQPLVTCPLHQHLLTFVHSLFQHFIICQKRRGGRLGTEF